MESQPSDPCPIVWKAKRPWLGRFVSASKACRILLGPFSYRLSCYGDALPRAPTRGRNTLVRREGSDAFYWAVTDDSSGMATSICFGWPAQVMIAGGNEYFGIRTDITSQDIVPMVVDSLQGWIVQHIRWLAPCAHFASTHQCVLLGVADGVADTALRAAARKAFYGLGRQALYGLGRKLGAEVTWGMKLFDLVLGLVHFCLPDLDDAELYSILSLRCPRESVWGEFLKTEEAQDLLGDSKDEDCMVVACDMEKKSATEGEYTAAFAAHRAKVKALRESAQPKRGGQGRGKAAGGAERVKKLRLPTKCPELMDSTTEHDLQAAMPPGFRVYKDMFNCRWQLTMGKDRILSRSWGVHGYTGAAKDILQASWLKYSEIGGELPSWVAELQRAAPSTQRASGSGAASSRDVTSDAGAARK